MATRLSVQFVWKSLARMYSSGVGTDAAAATVRKLVLSCIGPFTNLLLLKICLLSLTYILLAVLFFGRAKSTGVFWGVRRCHLSFLAAYFGFSFQ